MTPAEQQRLALAKGTRIRSERARSKYDLRAGRVGLSTALMMECWQSATVYDVLVAQRGWGARRTGRLLGSLGINSQRLVRQLTDRQRGVITAAIEDRVAAA